MARLIGAPVKAVPGHEHPASRPGRNGRRRTRRRARLLRQSQQSSGDPAAGHCGDLVRRAHPQRFTGHRRADRRGLSRLRDRSAPQDADPDGARDAERARCADVLEGLRDGRPARRLRDRAGRHDQEAARAGVRCRARTCSAWRRRWPRSPTRPVFEQEAQRNTAARQFTLDWFTKNGYKSTDSQCNFIFVDVKRPAKEFRDACRKQDVVVGRDFPPFEKSHVRISIGTMDEMKRAVGVFGQVLGVKAVAA